jgi:4'-phosphopantetheinyl transferase EntD
MEGMKSEIHQRGFMSVRQLLAIEGYEDRDLYYDQLGKPHLTDKKHISITHSHNFSAIITSFDEVGIDIEKQRPKIVRIAHKFTTPEDYADIQDPQLMMRKLTMVWGAKESLYKSFARPGLSFRQHIDVGDFKVEDLKTTARVEFDDKLASYDVWFNEFEGFTCAYAKINSL